MNTPENNENLFMETLRNLWAAFGDRNSWKSKYTERLMKNLMAMSMEPDEFPNFNETMFESALGEYTRRKVLLIGFGEIQD